MQAGQPDKWNIMLKGPRGRLYIFQYYKFSVMPKICSQNIYWTVYEQKELCSKIAKKAVIAKQISGYYYYELKLPKKDIAYLRLSWVSVNGNTAVRVDCYDEWSKYAVKLECPK